MAYIEERHGNFRCQVHKNGHEFSATFKDRATAELWGAWKENLIEEISNFNVPLKSMITLEVATDLKIEILLKEKRDRRTIDEVRGTKSFFSEWVDWDLNKITYDILLEKCNEMMGAMVRKGGSSKNNTGRMVMQKPKTVLKKFRVLSAIFSCMIEQGMQIENVPQKVCAYIRTKIEEDHRG